MCRGILQRRVLTFVDRVAVIGVPSSEHSSNVMTIMSFPWVHRGGTWRRALGRWWPRVAAWEQLRSHALRRARAYLLCIASTSFAYTHAYPRPRHAPLPPSNFSMSTPPLLLFLFSFLFLCSLSFVGIHHLRTWIDTYRVCIIAIVNDEKIIHSLSIRSQRSNRSRFNSIRSFTLVSSMDQRVCREYEYSFHFRFSISIDSVSNGKEKKK